MTQDNELNKLREEVTRLQNAIRYHRDQKGDERCHLDDDRLYEVLPEGKTDVARTLPCNFLENCKQFFEKRQNVPYKIVDDLYQGWSEDKPYLTKAEIAVLVELLQDASETLSNNGCNDFQTENTDENWEMYLKYRDFSEDYEDDEKAIRPKKSKKIYFMDWLLCQYLASKLRKLIEP